MKTNQVRIELVTGTGYDRNHKPLAPARAQRAIHEVEGKASRLFGGETTIRSSGSWIDPHGHKVSEVGRTIVIFAKAGPQTSRKAHQLADYARARLHQDSVALSLSPTRFEFIG